MSCRRSLTRNFYGKGFLEIEIRQFKDGSPIIGKTPVKHLYIDGGWCIGGFKAIPGAGWCFAHTIVDDEPHPLNAAFSLERFRTGRLLSEQCGGNTPHRQAH